MREVLHGNVAEPEGAAEVDFLDGHVGRGGVDAGDPERWVEPTRALHDGGVGDGVVDAAVEGEGEFEEGDDVGVCADVGLEEGGVWGWGIGGWVDVAEDDLGAVGAEEVEGGEADATVGAGEDYDGVAEGGGEVEGGGLGVEAGHGWWCD